MDQSKDDGDIELTVIVKVKIPKPKQTPRLPAELEIGVESSGQQFKRDLYQWLIEHADTELVTTKQQSEPLTCRGDKPFTFKTIFGSVLVRRNQVSFSNGDKEIPSINAWQTPQHSCITKGLRSAVCDLAVIASFTNTRKEIARRTGERNLLSAQSVLNILHSEGAALAQAQERRARAVYEVMPEARIFQIDPAKPWRKRLPPVDLDDDDLSDGNYAGPYGIKVICYWEDGKIYRNTPQHAQADGLIIIECDECIVPAQPGGNQKNIWVFTGVVNADGRAHYFTAETAAKLWYQIGALLGSLSAHQGHREILVIADGARWIRKWFRALPLSRKTMRLCWFHLTQVCHDLLTSGFGYQKGLAIEAICLRYLWRGEVMAAVNAIEAREKEVINKPKIRRLVRYLKARLPFIPNYQQCRSLGEWLANTRVEKFNNIAVANRCKGKGRVWGPAGVRAIAALVAAERNGELETWRQTGELPAWKINTGPPTSCGDSDQQTDSHRLN